ncbi:MAG: hypothetical protein RIT45_4113 [Pseudomonadota bacterium]
MLFLLKKLLGSLVLPLPMASALIAAGLLWAWRDARRTRPEPERRSSPWGLRLATAGALLLWFAASPPGARLLLEPLEREVPVLADPPPADAVAIVVLGSGYHPEAGRPLTSALSSHAVAHLAEGVRLARLLPHARLHCTGWGGSFPGSNADAACALAVELGIDATRTVAHPAPRDTAEEAAAIARAEPSGRVLLVTHAGHMPRAAALFRGAGVDVLPAPMGHRIAGPWSFWPIPSAMSLDASSHAVHEWIGRLWAWLRGSTR